MPQDNRPELEKEMGEIRREVIEARNLVIKTDNLLKNLHAEVKMVGKRQEDSQRRQWINSAAAYTVFAALCATFAVMYSAAKTSSASSERERLESTVTALNADLEKVKVETQARAHASTGAAEVYRLMTTLPGDERLKGIDAMMKLDLNKVSTLERQALQDRAVILRKEVGESAFERGKQAFRRNDMQGVVDDLSRFLAMNPAPADALDASFFLGAAYSQLRQHDKAVPLLTTFVAGDKRSKSREYAMLLLATSLEATGQLEKAAEVAREALGTYVAGEFNGQLRARLSSVKRAMPAPAGAASAPLGQAQGQGGSAPPAPAAAPSAATTTAAQPTTR